MDKTNYYVNKYDLNKIPEKEIIKLLNKKIKKLQIKIGQLESYNDELKYEISKLKTDSANYHQIKDQYKKFKTDFNLEVKKNYEKNEEKFRKLIDSRDAIIANLLQKIKNYKS